MNKELSHPPGFLFSRDTVRPLSRAELREKRIDDLLDSCRDQVLQQIIGPFGLTPAMFDDKTGGNVTTQHNAEKDIFAKDSEKYNRNDYNYEAAKKYKKLAAVKSGDMNSQEFTDAYTGKKQPTKTHNKDGKLIMNAELDHTVPLKTVHRKGGWMRSKVDRKTLSETEANLNYTTQKTNRGKKDKDPNSVLSKDNGFDESKTKPLIDAAHKAIDEKLPTTQERVVYHGKELLSTGSKEAVKNAIRQAMGMLLHETVSGTYVEVRRIAKEPARQENFVDDLIEALQNVAVRVRGKLDHVFKSVISGGVQGFISNLLTFIINNIITTSAKVVKVIREGLKGLWEAIKLVANPPEGMPGIDVARAATKIIAAVVTASLGLLFEKSVEAFILSIPLLAPLAGLISPAVTAILTGIIAALVVFCIDRMFDWLNSTGTEMLSAQIEHMEANAELFERTAQMLQSQFDNSEKFQLCIEHYREIEVELSSTYGDINTTIERTDKAVMVRSNIVETIRASMSELKNMNSELDRLLQSHNLDQVGA